MKVLYKGKERKVLAVDEYGTGYLLNIDGNTEWVLKDWVKESKDNINPDHYTIGGIETIDYLQAKLSKEQFRGYLLGNIIKYMSRYQYKNGVEDVKKSQWYMNKLLESLEGE